jgi:hypothetical protein
MSGLPRYEIDTLIKEKRIRVAWRPNKAGKLHPLIYAASLWGYLDSLAEGPMNVGITSLWPPEPPAKGKELAT